MPGQARYPFEEAPIRPPADKHPDRDALHVDVNVAAAVSVMRLDAFRRGGFERRGFRFKKFPE